MSLKTGFATVLKAMRVSRGLTHKHMAKASSRGYMSKLEQGRSSPTVDKLTVISDALGLSPLTLFTLFTLTLSVERGEPIDTLLQRLKADIADLDANDALKGLGISSLPAVCATRAARARRRTQAYPSSQTELHFVE
ncbi:helix-turn-helix domain-containing protein [Pseudomonas sp. S60]|uniref:helix-turn-helix domain-containing protein n=1 Tax=Pseudomonas sp. S60 TaxID=211124 RepID=UPI00191302EB|nr:helix-turn-helix transcriptional regulator [Pseudomonas sp. S60]MBK5012445.1 helix-turn-helix domain-containing protein [Pseudomonas sp. S60]